MTPAPLNRAVQGLRRLAEVRDAADLTDRQLLERFAGRRDQTAFALLVRRHGPMVLGVCRRVLRHHHDAEDAFQAAFLVLARKASSVCWQESAGGWLFRVAYHLALKMKTGADRRRACPLPEMAVADSGADGELRAALDEELSRLPEKYRAPLLLCHCEGKTRAEAARQLGWKEGAVKIRLERGRQLLRARLTRRGLALSAVLGGALFAETPTPAALVSATAAAAGAFALREGTAATAASQSAVALAEGVLKAMRMTRVKVAALLMLAVGAVSLAVGLWAHHAFAGSPPEVAREPQPPAPAEKAAAAAPAPAKEKTPRVLLVADGPTREYQFVRAFFVRQMDKKKVELSIYLQGAAARPGVVQDVPPERMLKKFPSRLKTDEKEDAEDKYGNLANYDVIIAFDPDWSDPSIDTDLLERWVNKQGGALIAVAGPVHTLELAKAWKQVEPKSAEERKTFLESNAEVKRLMPVIDMYPVFLKDARLEKDRNTSKPYRLSFPSPEKFLKLDEEGKGNLAGWSEFFFDKQRDDDWQKTDDTPERGFYTYYPVSITSRWQKAKGAATTVATFHDLQQDGKPLNVPYLVTMPHGKGRTIYLGSGETWRLRQYREDFFDRFWMQLSHFAASADPAHLRKGGARAPGTTPGQRKAIDKGLKWLADMQHKDGHWQEEGKEHPVSLTALAGLALLTQGSTIKEGDYADRIRKAVDWLMARSQPSGLIGKADGEKYLDGHGHALLFLASVYGEEEDPERRRRLQTQLTRAVGYVVKAQKSGGGWGHLASGPDVEGDDKPGVEPTVLQFHALLAARGVGIDVPREPLAKARAYLEKNIAPPTPAAVAGLVGSFTAGEHNTPTAKKWLKGAGKLAPVLDPKGKPLPDQDLNVYRFALLAYLLDDDGYAKLFPESKPEDRITWGEYRKKVFEYLQKTQNADGSWDGTGGQVRATALYLTVLQLDYGAVPIYQR
jgi:RNA polymerase sigma factor (sigma-70 family)